MIMTLSRTSLGRELLVDQQLLRIKEKHRRTDYMAETGRNKPTGNFAQHSIFFSKFGRSIVRPHKFNSTINHFTSSSQLPPTNTPLKRRTRRQFVEMNKLMFDRSTHTTLTLPTPLRSMQKQLKDALKTLACQDARV